MADQPKALPLFPVYLYEEGFEPPTKGTYYLVTKSGVYIHKQTKAGDALVKVDGIPWLKEPEIEFRLKLPKIPARIIGQALAFFRKVFDKYKAEAYVTLLYSAKLNQYRLWCPKQKVSMASVNYDRNDQVPPDARNFKVLGVGEKRQGATEVLTASEMSESGDWQMVGTIHSHCDFSAYHSGTDVGDEDTFDGIHVTLGHVNRQSISMASSVAINKKREQLDPENCCLGVVRHSNTQVVKSSYMTWGESHFFDLEFTEEEAQALVQDEEIIEKEWMPKVERYSYSGGTGSYYSGGGKGNSFFLTGTGEKVSTGDEEDVDPGSGRGDWWRDLYGRGGEGLGI